MALLAEYGFETDTSPTFTDLSGNGHTGTLAGSATWNATGHSSSGRITNPSGRSAGSGMTVPRSGLEPSTAVTVMCWVRLTANDGSYQVAVSKGRAAAGDSYAIYSHFQASGAPAFYLNTTNGEIRADGAAGSMTLNTWRHVAGTYDGASAKFYLDGTLVSTVAGTGTLVYDTTNLGVMTSLSFPAESLTGDVDDVRIYDTALTGAEITTLMGTPAGTSITGAVAATLPALTSSVAGTYGAPGTGVVAATLPALTAAAVGTFLPPVTGVVAATLPALTASITNLLPTPASRTFTVPAESRTYTVT